MYAPIIQVDAFTTQRFSGNPAAVCLLAEEADPSWMQAVAAEMNLSETAFVRRVKDNTFSIRWFTPTVEVPLCGHATLASAHALWEHKHVEASETITFKAKGSILTATPESGWICLDFPAMPVGPTATPKGLVEGLGGEPIGVYESSGSFPMVLAEMNDADAVRALKPDFARMRHDTIDACIVTARDDTGEFDFVSRFFGPGVGVDEDPVTGSAHCSLGPFWSAKLGKTDLVGHQVSARGGVVRVRSRGDRVDLLGQAVTVMRGELLR